MPTPITYPNIYQWTKSWAEKNFHGKKTFHQLSCESTNTLAKNDSYNEYHFFLTDQQTLGKGRGKNIWQNPPAGSALMATWAFTLTAPLQHHTSLIIGFSLYQSLKQHWPDLPLSIKCPNDVYLGEKKIAGILAESISYGTKHRLILGIGLNVTDHPKQTVEASSLLESSDLSEPQWKQFLSDFNNSIESNLKFCTSEILDNGFCNSLVSALNNNPLLERKYSRLDAEGNLWQKDGENEQKISWRNFLSNN